MGYQDRFYAGDNWSPTRHGPRRSGGGFSDWEVWKKLIAINIAVFLLQIFITRPATEADLMRLPYFSPDLYEYGLTEEDFVDDPASEPAADEDRPADDQADKDAQGNSRAAEDEAASKSNAEADESQEEPTKEDQNARQRRAEEMRERMREQMFAYLPRVSVVQEWLELDSQQVKQGQLWRLITSGFCHDRTAIWHLLFNMLFLYWFGKRLEYVFGAAEFTAFYFTSLLVASLAYIGLDLYTQTNIPAIGASGAIWGILALYALMYPYERIYIYFLFPVEIRWLALVYFLFDLHPVLLALAGDRQFTGVAHAAHIGGAIFGFLYWKQGWRLMPFIESLRLVTPRDTSSTTRHARTIPMKRRPADRLDEILKKISQQGRESLTEEELKVLEEASRKMREQRHDDA